MALQIRRGTNAERLGFTPVEGEIIYVTDSQLVTVTGTSVNDATDTITCSVEHGLSANQKVKVISNDGFGLVENTVYYVLESGLTDLSFKLSLTQGGAPVNVSNTGGNPVFAVSPTDPSGTPYGYSIAPVWAGDGLTAGGIAAGAAVLDELNDVTIGVSGLYGVALNDYQHLQYDGTTNQWRNVSNVVVPGTLYVSQGTTLNGNLAVNGNTTLGNASTDTVTFTGTNVSIPNSLNIDSNTLIIDAVNNTVGIGGTAATGNKLDVAGNVRAIGNITTETNLNVKGNTTLGDGAGDSITFLAGNLTPQNNLNIYGSGASLLAYLDYTNRRVGIKNASPSVELDVTGQMYVSGKGEVNGDFEVNGNTTLGDSSGDTVTLNGYNLYIPNSLAFDTDLLILNSGENKIGIGGNIDTVGSYRVNVTGGIQTSGDININGADLRSDATTFNVFPANVTTLNVGNVATTVNIGATGGESGGTTTIRNNALVAGDLQVGISPKFTVDAATGDTRFFTTTDSTSQDTGGVQIDGGVGINKHLHVGGSLSVDNTDAAINPTTGSIQTDGGLGVVGTAWIGGDLRVDATTVSTSTTTGAIQTDGGLGVVGAANIGGDTNIGGSLTVTGNLTVNGTTTTVNSTTLTVDDKNIELGSVATPSDTTANGGGITLKATTDKTITWNSSTNRWSFNVGIDAPYSEIGNVAIAPSTNDNRVTTTTGNLELGANSGVVDIIAPNLDTTQASITIFESAETITVGGIDTTNIQLGDNAADPKTAIFANGDLEVHDNLTVLGSSFLGNTIELDTTAVVGEFAVDTQGGSIVVKRANGRLGVNTANPDEKLHVVGNIKATGNAYIGNDAVVEAVLNIANDVFVRSVEATTATTSLTAIDNADITALRTVKYVIQAKEGTNFHACEALLTHDGTTAYMTVYGEMFTNTSVMTLSCDISGGFMRLLVTPASANTTTYTLARTAIKA